MGDSLSYLAIDNLLLKLYLDIVHSSSADNTRTLRGCFRGGSVYVSFRFVSKESKMSNAFFDILITNEGVSALSICSNTFKIFKMLKH